MSTEAIVVLLIVGAAAASVVRRVWKATAAARKQKAGCGTDCGCGH
jgi:type II secretory pathway pseudopilin PulG